MLRPGSAALLFAAALALIVLGVESRDRAPCKYLEDFPDGEERAGSDVVQSWLADRCRDDVLADVVNSLVDIVEASLEGKTRCRGEKEKHGLHRHRIGKRQADPNETDNGEPEMGVEVTEKPTEAKPVPDLELDEVSVTRQLHHLRQSLKQLQGLQETIDRRQGAQIRILENLMEDSMQRSNDEWKQKMEEFEKAIEIWEAEKYVVQQVRELTAEKEELKDQVGNMAQAVVRIQSFVLNSKSNYDGMRQQVAQLVTANQMLQDKLNETAARPEPITEVVRQHEDHGPLNEQLATLQSQVQSTIDITNLLQSNYNELMERIQPIQSLIRELDVTTSMMRDENFQQFNNINAAINALQGNHDVIIGDVTQLKEQVQGVVETAAMAKSDIDIYHERFSDLETSLSEHQQQMAETVEDVHGALGKINDTLANIKERGLSTFNAFQQKLETLENNTRDMDHVVTHLRRQEIAFEETNEVLGASLTCLTQSSDLDEHQCYLADCSQLSKYGGVKKSGVYTVQPEGSAPIRVWCDMETDGGGWTVIQKRADGSVDFKRNWTDYKEGFGDIAHEHWLGNKNIHAFTKQDNYVLRIDLYDWKDKSQYAEYNTFRLEDEVYNYMLQLGSYSGSAGDSMVYHNGIEFSTMDRDNDKSPAENAAERWKGGWWYRRGYNANLNGLYYLNGPYTSVDEWTDGIVWEKWHSWWYSLKSTAMKIRPRDFLY